MIQAVRMLIIVVEMMDLESGAGQGQESDEFVSELFHPRVQSMNRCRRGPAGVVDCWGTNRIFLSRSLRAGAGAGAGAEAEAGSRGGRRVASLAGVVPNARATRTRSIDSKSITIRLAPPCGPGVFQETTQTRRDCPDCQTEINGYCSCCFASDLEHLVISGWDFPC
jgi:hypothetical protein